MRSIKFLALTFLAIVVVGMTSTAARATLLAAGGSVAPNATASPAGAFQLNDTGVVPFASVDAGASFTGSLRTQVFTNDPSNPSGLGALTFTYLLTNNGPDALEQLSTSNFTGYVTDVAFNAGIAGPGLPFDVTRSANGKILGWQFDQVGASAMSAGVASFMLVVHTDAVNYVPINNSVINSSVATVASFGPAPIPEPATIGLISLAGAGIVARRRSSR